MLTGWNLRNLFCHSSGTWMAKVKVSRGCQVSPSFWQLYSLWQYHPIRFFLCGLWVPKLSVFFLLYMCLFMCAHQRTTVAVLPRVPSHLVLWGMCVEVHSWTYTHTVHVRAEARKSFWIFFPITLHFIFWDKVLTEPGACWLSCCPQTPGIFLSLPTRIISIVPLRLGLFAYLFLILHRFWRIKLRSLCLQGKYFYWLCHHGSFHSPFL